MKKFLRHFASAFNQQVAAMFSRFTHHWLLWILPLAIFILISSLFSRGVLTDLPVGYIDNDHSQLSRRIVRDLNAASHAKMIAFNGNMHNLEQALKHAKIYALLYIPANFEADVLAGRQPATTFYYNALYYSAGLYSVTDYAGLMAQLNSEYRLTLATKIGLPVPALAKVNFVYGGLFNASGNSVYYQQFSAVVHLLQLFVVMMTIHLLAQLPRRSRIDYPTILGKLAPFTLWYSVLLIFEIAMMVLFSSARLTNSPFYMLMVAFCYVIAAQSVGILLFAFTNSTITAYSLIGILVGLALTYSGITVPELSMPLVAQIISHLEPLTYALNTLFDIFLRHVDALKVIQTCAILLCYPLLVTLLVRRRLVRRVLQGDMVS